MINKLKFKSATSTPATQKTNKFKEGKIGKSKTKIPKLNLITKEKINLNDSTISKLLKKSQEEKKDISKFTAFKFKGVNGNTEEPIVKKAQLNGFDKEPVLNDSKIKSKNIANIKKNKLTGKIVEPSGKKPKIEKEAKKENLESTNGFLPDKLALDAINAVYKLDKTEDKKKKLFKDEGTIILLHYSLFRAPSGATHKRDINLPHKLLPPEAGIVAIIQDDKTIKKHSFVSASDKFKTKLQSANITCIDAVMTFKELKDNYKIFEEKKRFSRAYDLILCDPRILKSVVKFLGQPIKSKPVRPFRINSKVENLAVHLDSLLHRATVKIGGNGIDATFIIARTAMDVQKSYENLLATLKTLHQMIPGGKENLQSLFIKTPTSSSVPLFVQLSSGNDVEIPVLEKKLPKHAEPVQDELSTFKNPDVQFKLLPDGKVIKIGNEEEDEEEDLSEDDSELSEEESDSEDEGKKKQIVKKKGKQGKEKVAKKVSEKNEKPNKNLKKKANIEDMYEEEMDDSELSLEEEDDSELSEEEELEIPIVKKNQKKEPKKVVEQIKNKTKPAKVTDEMDDSELSLEEEDDSELSEEEEVKIPIVKKKQKKEPKKVVEQIKNKTKSTKVTDKKEKQKQKVNIEDLYEMDDSESSEEEEEEVKKPIVKKKAQKGKEGSKKIADKITNDSKPTNKKEKPEKKLNTEEEYLNIKQQVGEMLKKQSKDSKNNKRKIQHEENIVGEKKVKTSKISQTLDAEEKKIHPVENTVEKKIKKVKTSKLSQTLINAEEKPKKNSIKTKKVGKKANNTIN